MAKGRKGPGLSSRVLREAAHEARTAVRERAAARVDAEQHPDAAAVAQRVYNAAVEAKRTGEAGDVSPILWAPLAVAAEMMATVVCEANRLDPDEYLIDVAAYFTAALLAGGHGFDFAHFEQWRRRTEAGDGEA